MSAVLFGQLVCLVTKSLVVGGPVFVLFKVKGRPAEVTLPVSGAFDTFVFNRPFSLLEGQRMFIQVIKNCWDGRQEILGYAWVDMVPGSLLEVPVWRPKAAVEEIEVCSTEDGEDGSLLVRKLGTLVFHIQGVPGYT